MFRSDSFRGKLYEGNQILELTKGLQRGLDVSAYADPGFRTSQTEEKMVVYQSLKDQRVWIRPYDMFISKVDREKYPNAYQPYRLIKVNISI